MLRTVGLCVIVISGVSLRSFAMSNELGRRKKMMEMILRMIILLRGEIRYGNKSLYDAFTGASGKLEGKYREFFILTSTENERKNRGFLWDNLQRIGRKVSGSGLSFAGRERQILFTGRSAWLSCRLRYALKQMDLMEKETEYAIRELRKDFCEKRKLYRSMGILANICGCVFLVRCFIYNLFLYCVDYCFAISGSRSRKGETVEVSLIFKIAAVGILVSVLCQILKHSGRDEQAFLVSLAGLLMVLFWIVPYIYELFEIF